MALAHEMYAPRSRAAVLLDQYVGAKLKQARTARGLEVWQLAQKTGQRIDVLVDYERGTTRMPPRTLADFARLLGIETRWFFDGYLADRA